MQSKVAHPGLTRYRDMQPNVAHEADMKGAAVMEYGTIEREIHVDASPQLVFEVVSRPVERLVAAA
jgi:hypothetical protein